MLRKLCLFVLVIGDLLCQEEAGRLSLSVWEVYSDTVILDWLISLESKFRMNSCLTRYGPVQEDTEDHRGDQVLEAVPEHRSVKIPGLVSNTSYWLMMSCSDIYGNLHNSSLLNFTTEAVDTRLPVTGLVRVASGPDREKSKYARSKLSKGPEISPHALLGLGCGSLILIITIGTVAVVILNYIRQENKANSADLAYRSPGSPAYGDRSAVCEEVLTVSLSCSRSELDMARTNTEEEAEVRDTGDQQLIQI